MKVKIESIIEDYINASKNNAPLSDNDLKYSIRKLDLSEDQSKKLIKKLEEEWDLIEHLYIKIKNAKTNIVIGFIITPPILYFFWWIFKINEQPITIDIRFLIGAAISPFIIFSGIIKKSRCLKEIETRKNNWRIWKF